MKDKKPKPKKWQQDKAFVSWVLEVEYATRDPKLRALVSEGQVIYMWEAWCAGRRHFTEDSLEIIESTKQLFEAMKETARKKERGHEMKNNEGAPSWRYDHAMTYDSSRGKMVLFGGIEESDTFIRGDTWEWDGASWSQVSDADAIAPTPRGSHAMAYDSSRGVTVLFGGHDTNNDLLGDTWEWDGASWAKVAEEDASGVSAPAPRWGHAMTYDSSREVVVLFGGDDEGSGLRGDIWEWDGASWTKEAEEAEVGDSIAIKPTSRYGHALVYDASRGVTVLFGGYDDSERGDTWKWDGASWTKVAEEDASGVFAPTPRSSHAMTYDASRGVTVLFGGFDSNFIKLGDTWEWDGASWTKAAEEDSSGTSAPIPRWRHAMTYDVSRGVVVLFGGMDDATGFEGDNWEWVAWTSQAATWRKMVRLSGN